jgi:hypothetical protein
MLGTRSCALLRRRSKETCELGKREADWKELQLRKHHRAYAEGPVSESSSLCVRQKEASPHAAPDTREGLRGPPHWGQPFIYDLLALSALMLLFCDHLGLREGPKTALPRSTCSVRSWHRVARASRPYLMKQKDGRDAVPLFRLP